MKGIYVIEFETYPNIYKIGCSRNIKNRIKQIKADSLLLGTTNVVYQKEFQDFKRAEKVIHELLKEYRVQGNREFFKADLDRIKETIDSLDSNEFIKPISVCTKKVSKVVGEAVTKKQKIKTLRAILTPKGLDMRDLVIYAYLKKHYNAVTRESYPSLDLLAEESGISKPTVVKCLTRLEAANYIMIRKIKRCNHYTFSDIKKFEIYSFDFLEDSSLSTSDKAYIICMQPHIFKDSNLGIGKVTYSELDIAKQLNIDLRTLRKYENRLQQGDRHIMSLIPSKKRDPVTGLIIQERVFDFEAYNNILALKFQQIDSELKD